MAHHNFFKKATVLAASVASSALGAQAQGLLVSNGTIIAANGDSAPGAGAGVVFGGTGTVFDTGVMDDAGNVFFRAQLQGPGVVATNLRAYFVGTDRTNLTMVIRGGDPVPTLTPETLNTATASGIGGSPRISANGTMFWTSNFSGGAATTANDSAIFVGPVGGPFIIASREGDPAPGSVGATMSTGIGGLSQQPTAINAQGRIIFQSATLGGDTTPANNAAWFGGVPGALEMIIRKGDAIPSGEVIGSLGFQVLLNAAGLGFHDESLSTTLGTPPASAANNSLLMVYTPGGTPGTGTNAILLREGDVATGTTSALFSGAFGFGASPWNNIGKAFVHCTLTFGDAVPGVNDTIHYLAQIGSQTVVHRKGDVAPGTGGLTFAVLNTSGSSLNNNDRVAFQCTLAGGGVTTANDSSIWSGPVGGLQMVMREGDPALGTVGAAYGDVMGLGNFWINDMNQVTFQANLVGGDVVPGVNELAFYSWEPNSGLTLLLRKGSMIEVVPSVFKTVGSWGGIQFTNGDCRALTFNASGKLTMRVNFTDGTAAIMSVYTSDTVIAGSDIFVSPAGGSSVSFSSTPIPAGFFGPGSDPFNGIISLGGAPLGGTGLPAGTDTIVERLSPVPLIGCPAFGSVPIEIVALNLVSVNPVTVTFNGGTSSSQYNLRTQLSGNQPQAIGQMLIGRTSLDGGNFDSFLPVTPNLLFTKVSGIDGVPVIGLDPAPTIVLQVIGAPWSYDDGGVGVPPSAGGLVDHDGNVGTPMIPYLPTTNFIPGILEQGGDCLNPGISARRVMVQHTAPDHEHGVTPPAQAPAGQCAVFCLGDGTGIPCPCGNHSILGDDKGCMNSLAVGGRLRCGGNATVGGDTFQLFGTNILNGPGLFIQSNGLVPNGVILGDGKLCAAIGIIRLGVVFAGNYASTYPSGALPAVSVAGFCNPGDLKHYQLWYRDAALFCTPATNNLTNGVSTLWQ